MGTTKTTERCACGQPLHYPTPALEAKVRALIETNGEFVEITVAGGGGTWRVQRHYIALHGLRARDIPSLGLFERVQ